MALTLGPQTSFGGSRDEDAARALAHEQAWAAAEAEYEKAKAETANGSRAYAWRSFGVNLNPTPRPDEPKVFHSAVYLLVRPDGQGVLIDVDSHRYTAFPEEVAAFEQLVRRAGFPHFRRVTVGPRQHRPFCFDAGQIFEANIRGRHAEIKLDGCNEYAPSVQRALDELFALVKAHGGHA